MNLESFNYQAFRNIFISYFYFFLLFEIKKIGGQTKLPFLEFLFPHSRNYTIKDMRDQLRIYKPDYQKYT
jgi:hypothetical protein